MPASLRLETFNVVYKTQASKLTIQPPTAGLYHVHGPLYHPDPPRKRPPYRIHPIRALSSNGSRNGSPGLQCAHPLHDRSVPMSTFRSCLLLPPHRALNKAALGHYNCRTALVRRIPPTTSSFDLPLQSCHWIMAIWLATRAYHL